MKQRISSGAKIKRAKQAKLPKKPAAKKTVARRPHSSARPKVPVAERRKFVDAKTLERLQEKLAEAQETLDAIRNGEVDAVIVQGPQGSQVYSLAGAEQPYRVYIEQMQEGAVTLSSDGLILYTNRRFADMLGIPLDRVISTSIQNYLPAKAWEQLCAILDQGQEVAKHECVLTGASALPVHLTASRLSLADQDVLCLVVTDLTEQKERSDLRLGKELAEKANATKDSFLAALSHELRTPLTPALTAAVALEREPSVPESLRADISLIRRNIELEARLIDDLLDLTRIARGKLELHTTATNLHDVLQQSIEICKGDIQAKNLNLETHFDANDVQTSADAVRLQQVFWNIIRNAVKFTPPGGNIRILTANPAPHELLVEVADNGIGFDPRLSERIFEAFEQAGRQITREHGGLGLGLAICRSIMESHGGRVTARSDGSNRGATFTVHIPLRPSTNGSDVSAGAMDKSPEQRPLRILLVEDHYDTRISMARLLGRQHHVSTAESAGQALALASRQPFDLVISDLGLPDRSGLDLMRQLRDDHRLQGICISGYGMEDDISRSQSAGFARHLTKPISLDHLLHAIRDIAKQLAEKPNRAAPTDIVSR